MSITGIIKSKRLSKTPPPAIKQNGGVYMSITKSCSITGCMKSGRLRLGFCSMHYWRIKKYNDPHYQTAYDKRHATIIGDIAKIPLGLNARQGYTIVDRKNVSVENYNWHLDARGYAVASINGRETKLHRYLLKTPKGLSTDHKDGDPLNNRENNIRICTQGQNNANARLSTSNTSGYKGVSYRPDKKRYIVRVGRRYLGLYESKIEAAKAYNKQAVIQYGKFAKLNELLKW